MTTLAPAALDAPTRTNSRIGLLASALRFPDGTRWHGGISYRPLNGNVPAPVDSTYYPCSSTPGIDLETIGVVSWEPFGIGLGETCLSSGTDEEEEDARAKARLEGQTEYLVSRTFWTGEVNASTFDALGSPNRALSDLDSDELTTTGPVGLVTGLARLIEYLNDNIGSQRGMIHVDPQLLPFLSFYGLAERTGNIIVTKLADHIIVPGAGYDGSAPDGSAAGAGTSWMYATSMVRAEVSQIFAQPFFNRANNKWETIARRFAIAEWDLQAHGAAQVCLPDPGPS